jgi:serine/threonine-protein kinase
VPLPEEAVALAVATPAAEPVSGSIARPAVSPMSPVSHVSPADPSADRGDEEQPSLDRRVLGRYELLREIARGGMASVHLARIRGVAGFERIVAVKCCHARLRDDAEFHSMFLDEARLAAKIHHPNVVPTLDAGEDGELYLVMEYVEGGSLQQIVRSAAEQKRKIPVGVALRVVVDSLNGLHAAHELCDARGNPLNLVHRDVSPQNIVVGTDGVARIMDFGIAKATVNWTVTKVGQVKGKYEYMPLEQLVDGDVTRVGDVYAAGVVLWEALTGQRLFHARTMVDTMDLVLHRIVEPPSQFDPDVNAALDEAVLRAIDRRPEARWRTAGEFADAIEHSGVRLATTREVATFVRELLASQIEQSRAILRALADENEEEDITEVMSRSPIRRTLAPFSAAVGNVDLPEGPVDLELGVDAEISLSEPFPAQLADAAAALDAEEAAARDESAPRSTDAAVLPPASTPRADADADGDADADASDALVLPLHQRPAGLIAGAVLLAVALAVVAAIALGGRSHHAAGPSAPPVASAPAASGASSTPAAPIEPAPVASGISAPTAGPSSATTAEPAGSGASAPSAPTHDAPQGGTRARAGSTAPVARATAGRTATPSPRVTPASRSSAGAPRPATPAAVRPRAGVATVGPRSTGAPPRRNGPATTPPRGAPHPAGTAGAHGHHGEYHPAGL